MKRVGYLLLVLVVSLLFAGCSREPAPADRFSEYISLWNQQKFDKMYDYLSADAKKKITKTDFTARYKKIYDDLQIKGLKINFTKPKEDRQAKEKQAQYSFTANMNSIAGPIHFTYKTQLKKETKDNQTSWYINWNTGFIFPELKEGDTLRLSTITPKRGQILDRNGKGMAVNGQVYEVGVVAGKLQDPALQQLASLLKTTPDQINQELSASWVKPGLFVPLKKVSLDDTERIAQLEALDGVQTRKVEGRIYPYKAAAAQLIGYIGPITADELTRLKDKGYTSSDMIGKRGLEQVLDEQLKGTSGVKIIIKKKVGGETVLANKPVVDGKDVKLTIDADLQAEIFAEMGGEAGASAAMNPKTGETLALVSSPSFDPNQAVFGFSADEWKTLQNDPKHPLITRFKQTYAPGSVMKAITASIGLDSGAIKPDQGVVINGKKWQKDSSWGGYDVTRVHDESPVNLEKAFVFSDNIYFAQAALNVGKDAFAEGLKRFGFGDDIEFLNPLEKSTVGTMSSDIELADSGYGQGKIEMNIVHLMAAYTPFINNGNLIKPILLAVDQHGQVLKQTAVSSANAGIIAADLRKVVSDSKGTAHSAEMAGYPLSGKTGTAEIKEKQGTIGTENGWFIAYNTNSPSVMVAMMIEGVQSRGGSQIPVQKVKDIFMKLK